MLPVGGRVDTVDLDSNGQQHWRESAPGISSPTYLPLSPAATCATCLVAITVSSIVFQLSCFGIENLPATVDSPVPCMSVISRSSVPMSAEGSFPCNSLLFLVLQRGTCHFSFSF